MKLLGFEVSRVKQLTGVPPATVGWMNVIRESFAGAFSRHVVVDRPQDLLAFSGVFSPCTLIAGDVAKLRVKLVEEDDNGICTEVDSTSPFLPVLRKPNHYQNRIQFWSQWIMSKLLWGNTYVLKTRESARGMVKGLYILDPARVKPLVATNGDVYYECSPDHLSRLQETITVPASEIIHDRMNCLWHPLVGVSPIYACALSATMGRRIQTDSTLFFQNSSRPSGILVSPGKIGEEEANNMKARWEQNYGGEGKGGTAVLGNGLDYKMVGIPAEEAQLIEQLQWTKEDIASCFHMPLFKVGGAVPVGSTIDALNLLYYTDCLQALIESAEICLDEGLELKPGYYTDFDLDGLLRMDTLTQAKVNAEEIKAGYLAPNEARARRNLKPTEGGDTPYLQQQNYSLGALAKRDAQEDPFGTNKPAPAPQAQPLAITAAGLTMNVPGMDLVADMVKKLDATMNTPVIPVKDKDGIVIAGIRKNLPIDMMDQSQVVSELAEKFIKDLETA